MESWELPLSPSFVYAALYIILFMFCSIRQSCPLWLECLSLIHETELQLAFGGAIGQILRMGERVQLSDTLFTIKGLVKMSGEKFFALRRRWLLSANYQKIKSIISVLQQSIRHLWLAYRRLATWSPLAAVCFDWYFVFSPTFFFFKTGVWRNWRKICNKPRLQQLTSHHCILLGFGVARKFTEQSIKERHGSDLIPSGLHSSAPTK